MSRFSSPAVALAYAVFVGMGVVALQVWSGRIEEALVQRFVMPPVLLTLAGAGLWEYERRRPDGTGDRADDDIGGADDDSGRPDDA